MINYVSFPGLFDKVFKLDPVAFEIGSLSVRWYGVIICLGFLLAGAYALRRCKTFGVTADDITDFALFLLPSVIIGARLYYVFSSWDYYSKNPSQIIKIWEGGLAIYGGIIAGVIVAVIFSKVKRIDFLGLGDVAVICLLIGQMIGRWGNFMNVEAFGDVTTLVWRMCSPAVADYLIDEGLITMVQYNEIINGTLGVHPTFLYESLWNFAGFIALHFYSYRRRFKGELILLYFGWYGLGRAWIEGLRTDSLHLGHTDIRISQLLAVISFVFCVGALLYLYIGKRYKKIKWLELNKTKK